MLLARLSWNMAPQELIRAEAPQIQDYCNRLVVNACLTSVLSSVLPYNTLIVCHLKSSSITADATVPLIRTGDNTASYSNSCSVNCYAHFKYVLQTSSGRKTANNTLKKSESTKIHLLIFNDEITALHQMYIRLV